MTRQTELQELKEMGQTPEIFQGAEDYKYTIEAIEHTQASFNEEGLYEAIVSFAISWFENNRQPAQVLDLCSSTGLSAFRVMQAVPVESVTLVDTDQDVLNAGVTRFKCVSKIETYCGDAVTFDVGVTYDIILMNSAYHHIADSCKSSFLNNAARLLAKDGVIIVGDNLLPPYTDPDQYQKSVVKYCSSLLQELELRGESPEVLSVIRKSGYDCWRGVDEFKVSAERFYRDVAAADLIVASKKEIWPMPTEIGSGRQSLSPAGSYAFLLHKHSLLVD